ncbi:MAG: hypothetical protein OXH57_00015 [Ekhidna sp.]|nr:hypothetical protein [Ekhidna sp.]
MVLLLLHLMFNPQLSGWGLLSDVEIIKGYDEFMGEEVDQPKFSENLMTHNGKEITLEGFIIPLEKAGEQSYFILSRFPYQSCFFCGAAGPETVVEVFPKKGVSYTDERVRVRGTLKLNKDNPLQLFYTLRDCEVELLN